MKTQKLIVIFAISWALAAMVALLGLAVPTAALAQTEINPGETLSDLDVDGGNITADCKDETDPLRRCWVVFRLEDNMLFLRAQADPTAYRALAVGNVFKTLTVSTADGTEDGSALIGSFLSMLVDWRGSLLGVGDAVASFRIEVNVLDITEESAPVLVASQLVASGQETEGPVEEEEVVVKGAELITLPLPLVRGHTYEIQLQGHAQANSSLDYKASANFFPKNWIRWLRLSVTAGQDPFEATADLQSQIDDLAAENEDQEARITALEEAANADVVTIYKAVYNRWRPELKVEANSGDGCDAMLTLVGYGPMECDEGKHKYKERGVPDPGKIVTVESSLGGSDTHPVIHWGWHR